MHYKAPAFEKTGAYYFIWAFHSGQRHPGFAMRPTVSGHPGLMMYAIVLRHPSYRLTPTNRYAG